MKYNKGEAAVHSTRNSGICCANNIILPSNISSVYKELDHKKSYDVIFCVGGYSGHKHCNSYIIKIPRVNWQKIVQVVRRLAKNFTSGMVIGQELCKWHKN